MLNNIAGILALPAGAIPVSGYSLWLDASDSSTFSYSSGSVVSQWNDKSTNAYNFTQATVANQPTRTAAAQNGLAAVTFSGDFMANASLNWGSSNSTLFMVLREDKVGNTGFTNIFTTGTGAVGQWGYGISSDVDFDKISLFDIGQAFIPFNSSASSLNADVLAFTSPGVSSGSVVANLFKNGSADSLNSRTITSTSSGTGALIGAATGGLEPFSGYICEVIIYPSQLSSTDRNAVESYLKTKWGTP